MLFHSRSLRTRLQRYLSSISFTDIAVIECKPTLKNLEDLVQKLNGSREFFEFLKWMRQAFKENALK
jgi:hypothetical protein